MTLSSEIFDYLDTLSPAALALDWDNSGLQVGSRNAPVRKILVILDDSKRDFSTFAFNVNCCSCMGFCVEISAPNSSLYAFLNCTLEFNANNTDS